MNKINFENLVSEIVGKKIKIYKPENEHDKYTLYFSSFDILEPSKKYGIEIEGNILYDFKTTKKIETFIKSFINQHIKKYELKQFIFKDGDFINPSKNDVIKKYKDQNRVNKYFYYTTLYGIGMFSFFTRDIIKANLEMANYLQEKKISYYNEFSDAGWAYRFVINKDVKKHNELLKNFNI